MDIKRRNKLVESSMHIAKKLATKWSRGNKERYDDMFQVACLSLISAAQTYSEDMDFTSYASTIISRDLSKWCIDNSSILSSPKSKSDRKIAAIHKLHSLTYDVSHNDLLNLADEIGIDVSSIVSLYNGMLYSTLDTEEVYEINETLEQQDLMTHVLAYLSTQNKNVQEVFSEMLLGGSISSIMKRTGLSRARVYEIIKSSIEELRERIN